MQTSKQNFKLLIQYEKTFCSLQKFQIKIVMRDSKFLKNKQPKFKKRKNKRKLYIFSQLKY